ncbi:alanine racemase [soil metagenome]
MREALVDLAAISSNVQTLRAAVGGMPSMVIVKANGYGHGAVPAARAAVEGGADWLGVADLSEALELRGAGITTPVLAWLHDPDSGFDAAVAAGVDIGVSYLQQLDTAAGASGTAFVQLKVDTGLGRNGSPEAEWAELFAAAAAHQSAGRIVVRGLWSHLANTPRDAEQIESFTTAVEAARAAGLEPEFVHLAATEGALRLPQARFGLVRFGIGTYGFSPDGRAVPGLRPAMELAAGIVSVKRVPVGHGVSYGHDFVTESETTLALVPLGYADGIPRHASGRAEVSIDGTRYPVAGRIAMDQFVVDVGDAPVSVGDRVVVFGAGDDGEPTATEWADWAGTIDYEIITRIGHRVPRTYRP